MRVDEAIPQYLAYLHSVARRSPATITAYRHDLARFVSFLGSSADSPLSDITPPLIDDWIASMRHLSTSTVRRALNALSALFIWAVRFNHAPTNPVDRIERPKATPRLQPCPSRDQVAALLHACHGTTERAALLAMATSGLRRAELLALQWPDVDLAKKRLRIHGKGDKHREVLIFPELAAQLHTLHVESDLPRTGPVFRGRQGKALQQSTLQRWFTLWCQRAGLTSDNGDRFTLHSLRRFAAKQWLSQGLNIRHVQILLGHNDLQTTIRYLNYDLDEIQHAAQHIDFALSRPSHKPAQLIPTKCAEAADTLNAAPTLPTHKT